MPYFGSINDGGTDTFIPDGTIQNKELVNSTVNYGGVTLSLGSTDATPAFDLTNAVNYPTTSLTGLITNTQLAGSISNDKLVNSSVSFGGVTLSLGGIDATPAFDLSDATNYSANALTGTTLNSGVTASSLTSVGTLTSLDVSGNITASSVGIGTDDPQVLLQLGSRTSANPQGALDVVRGEVLSGGTGPNIRLIHGPDGGTQRTHSIYSYIGDLRIAADSNENMEFHTGGSESLRITSGGDVGIGTDNPTAKVSITANTNNTTTSDAFVSAHIVSQASINTRNSAGANLYTDMAHTAGGFLSNGKFVQIIQSYSSSGDRNHLMVMNATTGEREVLKYIWTTNPSFVFNTSLDDGYLTSLTRGEQTDLRLDSNGNIVVAFERGFPSSTHILSLNTSTWTISNQYETSISDYRARVQVGEDGYTYYGLSGTGIYKINMNTGGVLYKLGSLPSFDWFDVDSSGNIYTASTTQISKYNWTGSGYSVAWAKTLSGMESYIRNAKLTSSAIIFSCGPIITSFNTSTGNINWSRDFSGTNLTIPEVDAESFEGNDEWKYNSNTYSSTLTVNSSNIYLKYYINDGNRAENYEYSRYCIIFVLNISTGNCVDSLLIKKNILGGYGEFYLDQHGIYWNNNQLIVPNVSGMNPKTGDFWSRDLNDPDLESTAYSYIENLYLNTSNLSSNVSALGPQRTNEIINSGSSLYQITTNSSATAVNLSVSPTVTTNPTDLTLTSNTGIQLYDETAATNPNYLIDNETVSYLSPSVPDTVYTNDPSSDNILFNRIKEDNIYRDDINCKSLKTSELRLGVAGFDDDQNELKLRYSNGVLRSGNSNRLLTNFNNCRLTSSSVQIGYCPNDPSNPSNDYYFPTSSTVQIGSLARATGGLNVIVGAEAGPNTTYTDNSRNTFIGSRSGGRLANANIGESNVAIGHFAGTRSTGSDNISIGDYAAGRISHTGSKQITIGNVSQPSPTTNIGLAIGYYSGLDFEYTLGSESYWLTGDSSFNVDIPNDLTAGSISSSSKAFNIPHPSPNKEGIRLWHGCLEGPEYGVYVRGRVTNQEEINLPEYWKDLVNVDTMTVSLTPIGSHQNVIVTTFNEEKVCIQEKDGVSIDCFYHIYGERKDIDSLVIEQEETSS